MDRRNQHKEQQHYHQREHYLSNSDRCRYLFPYGYCAWLQRQCAGHSYNACIAPPAYHADGKCEPGYCVPGWTDIALGHIVRQLRYG